MLHFIVTGHFLFLHRISIGIPQHVTHPGPVEEHALPVISDSLVKHVPLRSAIFQRSKLLSQILGVHNCPVLQGI